MSLTRRTLFRGAFVAAGYFLTRGVLRAEEEWRPECGTVWVEDPDATLDLEALWRAFYDDVIARCGVILQTTPSAEHWLEGQ